MTDQDVTPTLAEPHPELYSYEAAENGDYPAIVHDEGCKPCEASAAAWEADDRALDERWKAEQKALEAQRSEPEAGL